MTTPTTTGRPSEAASDPNFDIAALAGRLGRDQVFGPPTERGGTTLVPVARVAAGGGAGRGPGDEPAAGETGGGAGVLARPVGAFSIDSEGKVRWHPAVDVTRIVLGGQVVIAVVLATALRRRRRRRRAA